jgi:hypothetical protein
VGILQPIGAVPTLKGYALKEAFMTDDELIRLRDEIARLHKENEWLQKENKWLREENNDLKQLSGTLTTGLLQLPDYDQAVFSSLDDMQNKFVDLMETHLEKDKAHLAFTNVAIDTVNVLAEEVETGSFRQRKIAQRDRTDALQKLIIQILEKKPYLNSRTILPELEKHKHGVINDIDEELIYFNDKKGEYSAKISGLKDRVSRAKKKLKSR